MTKRVTTARAPARPAPVDPFPRIPAELKARAQWVVWTYGKKKNKAGKYAKIPHNARNRRKASTTDPATWSTYAEAWAAHRKNGRWAGIGYVFTADDPYTGVDFDHCIDGAGTLAPGIAAIVAEASTYGEVSPSGEGVKLILRGTLPAALKGVIEMYDRGRFFTLTGDALDGAPSAIAEGQALIDRLYAQWGGTARDTKRRQRRDDGTAPSSDLLDWQYIAWLEQHSYRLIAPNNIPYGAGHHLKHLLITDELPAGVRAKGDSPSERRAVVAAGLIAHMPEERYVIARAIWRRFGYESNKSERDLRADALRLIFVEYPVKASAYAQATHGRFSDYRKAVKDGTAPKAQPPQDEAPQRRGRKRSKIDAAGYLRWLLDAATSEYKVLGTRRENAAQLKCSVAHIDRLELVLRDAGVKRRTNKSRRDSWLEINRAAADAFLSAITIPAQTVHFAENEVLSSATVYRTVAPDAATAPDEGRTRLCALASPTPEPAHASAEPEPAAPPAAEPPATSRVLPSTPPAGGRPTLAEVIAEAVEAYGPKIKPARCHAAMYGYDDAEAVTLAHTRHIWALERAAVRAIEDDAELLKVCESRRKALARNIGKPREGYHRVRHGIADDERRRRRLDGPGATLKTPALLAMMEAETERDATERASRRRAVANHQRAERQDVAAVVELGATPRPAQTAPQPRNEASEGDDTTPPPQSGPSGPHSAPGYTASMFERLRALRAEREGRLDMRATI